MKKLLEIWKSELISDDLPCDFDNFCMLVVLKYQLFHGIWSPWYDNYDPSNVVIVKYDIFLTQNDVLRFPTPFRAV